MVRASLARCLWWIAARMGLCLGGVDDDELRRLLRRRLSWMVLAAGLGAFLVVLGGGLAGAPLTAAGSGASAASLSLSRTLGRGVEGAAAIPALLGVMVWWYARRKVRRARGDRAAYPVPCRGTVRGLVSAGQGGWPVLVRSEQGRWLWLTGSEDALAPVRRRIAARRRGVELRFSVTLTYYPRCRVVHAVTGMAVEELGAVVEAAGARAASPA